MLIKENESLKNQLVKAMEYSNKQQEPKKISNMLRVLLDCAMQNADKKPGGKRYDDVVKELGYVMFSVCTLEGYEILCSNLPLPSVTNIRRMIYARPVVTEAVFRTQELLAYLLERNLPLRVHLPEDATRNEPRIQYHPASNQVVGFVLPLDSNGLPVAKSFPATSAQIMSDYFKTSETSNYVYCIMAQPLSEHHPAFLLAMFGSNNKFNASQVAKRWEWTRQELKKLNIEVDSNSSDGDPRLLKSMMFRMFPQSARSSWSWFRGLKDALYICIQDFIHIATKLKSRLLKASIIMALGALYLISRGHLVDLIKRATKDLHQLTMSDINPKDKMNYRAVQKMSDKRVTALLRAEVPCSEGTATFLDMMREVLQAFEDRTLTPLQRVEMIWEWVFFLRMWRQWILDTEGYNLQNNFITSNAYNCIEINAHSLIQTIIKLRENEEPHLFQPWLMGSQPCEKTFRKLRSTSTSRCGVVSFSILELQNHFRRIDLLSSSYSKLENDFIFPRHHKAFKTSKDAPHIPVSLPEDYEIEAAVLTARDRAVERAIKLKIIKKPSKSFIPTPNFRIIPASDMDVDDDDVSDSEDEDDPFNTDSDVAASDRTDDSENEDQESESELQLDRENELGDVVEDLFVVSSGRVGVRTYNHITPGVDSPFVEVSDGLGNKVVIRKSTLLYLESDGDTKLSSDRLVRVSTSCVNQSSSRQCFRGLKSPRREDEISLGDWCAFKEEDGSVVIGMVTDFSYRTGATRKSQQYSRISAPTSAPQGNARGLDCLCNWFRIGKNRTLNLINMDVQGYYALDNYICSLPRPELVRDNVMRLSCSVKDILMVSK